MGEAFLGIDIGTSACKVLALSAEELIRLAGGATVRATGSSTPPILVFIRP
ncbi:hypothetical protein H1W37_00380 [Stappia taiwanensis]|uniref:Uncharacterized protein n=1 Tax=Stappia taiwanensis TaxID=992267 RepID=A0A838XMT9_9HYPH|nr:hypothetical protein [Stappia taiwanensis]MBA4610088.1 hypothetical protein [Stappia taiwanensis]GGE76822.1 hypothetical protein GCM10007285_00740 [Stappia taiwanensis]